MNIVILYMILNMQKVPLVEELEPTAWWGVANVWYWEGGTMVFAHNYLEGAEFYGMETVTMVYADGSRVEWEVVDTVVETGENWERTMWAMSDVGEPTFVTCWPEDGSEGWLILDMEPVGERKMGR